VMLTQKKRRVEESGGRFMARHYEYFYHALAKATIQRGQPHIACLRVAGTIVASHVGAIHRNRFYWLMPGYEAGQWVRYSVGRLLLQALVEWCIAQGIDTFDLTVGDEDYKRFWADSQLKLYESRYARTTRGAILLTAMRLSEAARRNRRLRRLLKPAVGWAASKRREWFRDNLAASPARRDHQGTG
jgi:CelD/BcsL family acetyltransferase involved in cellulose biosynthesis